MNQPTACSYDLDGIRVQTDGCTDWPERGLARTLIQLADPNLDAAMWRKPRDRDRFETALLEATLFV